MCEFEVKMNGETIMKDVLYLEVTDEGIVLRDVLGNEKVVEGAQVKRIDMDEHVVEIKR